MKEKRWILRKDYELETVDRLAEALGVDMADYGGLDFEGELEHAPDYTAAICQDFLATIAKNPVAYELQ